MALRMQACAMGPRFEKRGGFAAPDESAFKNPKRSILD
jgi:hypothetical protein